MLLLLLLLPSAGLATGAGPPTEVQEYQVKAVFLYSFARFIEWPATVFATPDSPLIIGVVGEDPFGALLEETVEGQAVAGRKVITRRLARGEDLTTCHILFISRSERDHLREILNRLATASVATVGDIEGFAGAGGMLGFFIEDRRVRIEANPGAATRAGLRLSANLLRIARIVESRATEGR